MPTLQMLRNRVLDPQTTADYWEYYTSTAEDETSRPAA
jgi:hypothetical protein